MRNPPAGPGSRRVGSTRYGATMVRIGSSGGRGASTGNVNTLFDEDPATVHYKEAMLLRRQGKPDEALSHMEKAVKAKPDSPSFLYTLGIMYMEKQEYSKAIEAMKRSIRHIKSTGYTKVNLAMYSDAYMGALTNLGPGSSRLVSARMSRNRCCRDWRASRKADLSSSTARRSWSNRSFACFDDSSRRYGSTPRYR